MADRQQLHLLKTFPQPGSTVVEQRLCHPTSLWCLGR